MSKTKKEVSVPMNTLIIIAVVAILVLAFIWLYVSQPSIIGIGQPATQDLTFSDFTKIDAGSGFNVVITQSDSYTVSITADEKIIDDVEVTKTDDTLSIRVSPPTIGFGISRLQADITMPEMDELKLSGGAHGTINDFSSSENIVFDINGGSSLKGEFTTTGDSDISLGGGSQITRLTGAADNLLLDVDGGSSADLSDFAVNDADVNLASGSRATVNFGGTMDADLSGGSHLTYMGEGSLGEISESGGSSISKR